MDTNCNRTPSKCSIAIIACQIMEPEIEALKQGQNHIQVFYLDQGLHLTPTQMPAKIQEIVDRVDGTVDRIVLGYGLCSNGIVGVKARFQEIIVPLCHDCIAFFLGSPQAYLDDFHSRPGTYYLTPGWISERKDPLSIIEDDYVPRYGRETAVWAKKEELKHYTHIVMVDTGVTDIEPMRRIGRENAEFFGMKYLEIEGKSSEFFNKLAFGPYPEDEFIRLPPGQEITQDMFIG